MTRKTRKLFFISFLLSSGIVFALPSLGSVVSYDNHFGCPSPRSEQRGKPQYIETSINLVQKDQALETASRGRVLFSQTAASLSGGMPMAMGKFLALQSEDGMVAILSGFDAISATARNGIIESGVKLGDLAPKSGDSFSFSLRFYDVSKGVWVNPLLLTQLTQDSVPPRIESLILRSGRTAIEFSALSKGRTSLSQGSYSIFLRTVDTGNAFSSSGIFRYKILLDGQILLDKKMDSARSTANGLSFMGLTSPSFSVVDDKGRLGLGNLDLPRGQHLFELYVFDFSGNQARAAWRLTAE
ncbi:MAG: hypothetical protein NT061_00080 [Spirochaetes bacterium]|nr:hypothetical protein [Spirochaetota bacterium]